jgi:transcriptional regulator with XRE-family HTH domain
MRDAAGTKYGPWDQLRIIRARSEIRQDALASYVGISRVHLTNLERGHRWPTEEITKRLAQALRVPPEMIARGEKVA